MHKVIVERSRVGGSNSRKGRPPRDIEDYPHKESMKKKWKDRKSLNENTNPLKRFLYSKIGQKWDNVYSEICKNLSSNNAVQKHVKDHVFDYVSKNVVIDENEKVLSIRKYGGNYTELRNNELYICPNTGLLKKYSTNDNYKYKRKTSLENFNTDLNWLSGTSSKLLYENGKLYKLFLDPYYKTYSIKEIANPTHAINDFKKSWPYRKHTILDFFKKYEIDLKNSYFKKYVELIDKAKKEKKYNNKFKAGQPVLFSNDNGKTWNEGIINRIENEDLEGFESFWITFGDKNICIRNYHSYSKIRKIINATK